ncbi:MAG: peptidylprolyl isomerase [Gammaproteobacteria bacterium]
MSDAIADNRVVTIHYKLTDHEGTVLDSSEEGDPLNYLHGAGYLVPGLEKALVGKTKGDKLSVHVEPSEGYGEVQDDLMQTVDRSLFQNVDPLEPGMELAAQASDGSVQHIRVTAVGDTEVTIDVNHPLAGMVLNFDVEVIDVREATETEIEHGHVH